ncbi:uncharacterized protein [Struthio camelus]|uniref:uncharacterized protein isoform X5 n=1 Tax=Struthio camelus TaxID=8801 RepID=UPI003603E248
MRAAPTLLPAALSYEQRSTAGSRCAHAHLLGVARWCPRLAKNRYCRRSGAQAQWFRRGSLVPSAGQKSVLKPEKSVLQAKRGAGAVVSAWLVGALGWRKFGTAGEAGRLRTGFRRGSLVPSAGQKSVLQAKRGAGAVVSAWLVGALGWPEIGTAGEAGRRRTGFRRGSLVPSAGQKSVLQAKRGAGALGFGVARWCPRLARNRYCRRSGAQAHWVSAWLVGALGWPEIGTAGEAGRRRSGFGVAKRGAGALARRRSLVPSAGEKWVLQAKRGACAVLESRAPRAPAPRSRSAHARRAAHARRRAAAWRRAGTEFSLGRRRVRAEAARSRRSGGPGEVFRTSGIDYMLP